ncbi:hypothetical protein ZIOFF_053545 [Zingiber officinale]|uniref:Uncharacterized protein n=1 Tax=Zingiber officinale TaxID=94328 RepID=A0A8J5FIX2_ZINOF|nr:hypothetical protein ZIOFF_053545 [Zingiber officinale]
MASLKMAVVAFLLVAVLVASSAPAADAFGCFSDCYDRCANGKIGNVACATMCSQACISLRFRFENEGLVFPTSSSGGPPPVPACIDRESSLCLFVPHLSVPLRRLTRLASSPISIQVKGKRGKLIANSMLQLLLAVAFSAAPLTLYVPPIRTLNPFMQVLEMFVRDVTVYSQRAYLQIRLGVFRILAVVSRALGR